MYSSKHREPTSKIINVVFVLLSSLSAIGKALQLECGNGSDIAAVEENSSNFTLTCSGYSPKAYWTRRVPGYDVQNIGSCSDSLCQPDEQLDIVMTYLSRTSSSITIRYTTRENGHVAYNCTTISVFLICQTNIFVKASHENPIIIFNATDNWTIKGIIQITKIYSSLSRYVCQWKSISSPFSENGRLIPSNLLLTPSPEDLQNKADRTGTCSFRDNVANYNNNIYKFTVLVTPGGVPITTSTFEIARPLAPNTICITSNIPENSTLSCTCSTQEVGKPRGRLMWIKGRDGLLNQIINVGSYDVSTLEMEQQRLTRNDDGTQFQCIVDWATNVTGNLHTSNVNYGPDSVQIPENKTFITNINGTLELRLTCQAIAAKPLSGIVYSWTGPCRGVTNTSCTFRPHPPQPGNTGISNEVKCTARNPFNNNLSREDTFTIDLKYPPLQSPQITGYPQDLIIYAFDTLTLSCSINGGNPIASTTTLACFPYARNASTGKTAIISFNVPEGVDRLECNCSGMWIVPEFYPLSSNVQFRVYYPPSAPFISRNGSAEFPYLEGDTAYLVCNMSSSWGCPAAELIWSGQEENYVITKRLSPIATLQLNSLTWKDNGRNITCQAKNNYTKEKGLDIRNVIVLQVYYRPIISFQHGTDNQCVLTLDQEQCIIDKDERFEIICSAHSNPSPVNFTWRLDNSSGLVVSINANLTIANNITHNVTYICIVTTNSTYSNDTRPPLSAMKKLTFVIKEMPGGETPTSVGGIVGGVVGGIVFIGMVAVIVFIVRKRRKENGKNNNEPSDKGDMDCKAKRNDTIKDDKQDRSKPIQAIKRIGNYLTSVKASATDQTKHVKSSVPQNTNKYGDNNTSISPSGSAEENNLYAKVNKTTVQETPLNTGGYLSSDSSDLKQQQKKKEKKKEKRKKKDKKAENKKIIHQIAPLSMKPQTEFIYENVEIGFSSDSQNKQKVCIGSDKGLTYTTIQFTETQLNEGKKAPSKQDSTTYASIDFSNKRE